jgi:hypothetical protein
MQIKEKILSQQAANPVRKDENGGLSNGAKKQKVKA